MLPLVTPGLQSNGWPFFRLANWRIFFDRSSYSPIGLIFSTSVFICIWIRLSRLRAGYLFISSCIAFNAHAGDSVNFEIPEQSAHLALILFAEQADRTLLFSFDETNNKTANRLSGLYEPVEALELILAGTGLSISMGSEGQLNVTEGKIMNKPNLILGGAAAGLVAALGVANEANSASNTEDVGENKVLMIEEVMVSARRTSENLQKVPIAVTALTPTDMAQQNIVSPTDLMYAAPSLTIAPAVNSLFNTYAVRGLSTGVATYMAEAACCTGNPSVPFLDVASVQVLNGPQGTLFGRTSAAGSVLIEPARPNLNETEALVKVRFGDYGRQEITGMLNVPIIADQLAVRLAVNSTDIEGYTDEIGSSRKLDEQKSQQIRLGVQFENGRLTNYTAASYSHTDQTATSQVLSAINLNSFPYNVPPAFASATYGPTCEGAVALGLSPDFSSCIAQRVDIVDGITAALTEENARIQAGGDSAVRRTPAAKGLASFVEIENWSILNVAEFDDIELGPVNASVKNITSYEESADISCCAIDGLGGLILTNSGDSRTVGASNTRRDASGQIQILSPLGPKTEVITNDFNLTLDLDDGLLTSVLGYYYARTESPSSKKGTGNIAQNWSGLLLPELGGYMDSAGFNLESESEERAWYTQNTLDFSRLDHLAIPGLSFTAGYRKTWSESSSTVLPSFYDFSTSSFSPGPVPSVSEADSDGYNYLFTLSEQFTDDFMVYVSRSRAYVPGGVNVFGAASGAEDLPSFSPTYGPEFVEAWEVGAKIEFTLGENTPVRLNAAAYKYDYEDIIVGLSGFTSDFQAASYNTNAAAAKLQGFELSGWILPIENLEISFSYNYNDAEYKDWEATDPYFIAQLGDPRCLPSSTATTCVIDLSDNPFDFMPEHQWRVTVAYTLPLEESIGRVALAANVYAQSEVWLSSTGETALGYLQPIVPQAEQALTQESYSILNLRVDWSGVMGSRFDAAVFVNNVTDEVYKRSANPTGLQLMFLGFAAQNYGPPRMWGAEIAWRF